LRYQSGACDACTSLSVYGMPCLNCDSPQTIRAHLIPRVFATEVQTGKAHAASVGTSGRFVPSQSGLFDPDILCETCDGHIGQFEKYAATALARLRRLAATQTLGLCIVDHFDGDRFLRFCAALLWKYSVAKKGYGRIQLGPYQSIVRAIAFDDAAIPDTFDALIFRLKLNPSDEAVFAYRAPLLDRKGSINMVRFAVGGCVVFVRTDQRTLNNKFLEPCWIRGKHTITFIIAPAQEFEEFTKMRQAVTGNAGLSRFLDRQEGN
jgi:hypothetical protein